MVLSFFNLLQPAQNILTFFLNPLQKVFRQVGTEILSYSEFLKNISTLYTENQELKEQILTLQSSFAELHDLKEENQAFKDQFIETELSKGEENSSLEESADNKAKYLIANIIGNAADPTKSTIYIDKGYKHGISLDDPLIYKNNLVGKVIDVQRNRSLVALLYSPQVIIAVKNISSAIPTEGIVTGEFGTGLKLDRVLQNEALSIGDVFATTGREGIFEPNLIVGKVTEIYAIPTEPLKSAKITPLLEFDHLLKVFVPLRTD